MSTMTCIERLPADWDQNLGDWDDASAASDAWRQAFSTWLSENYPQCYVSGNEIHGPATYVYPDADVQSDTPPASELEPLPDSLYEEFMELHSADWADCIENIMEANNET